MALSEVDDGRQLRRSPTARIAVTTANFTEVLRAIGPCFERPLDAVRAFYASLVGEPVTGLLPHRRRAYAEIASRHVVVGEGERLDDFFAHYDRALDAVDPDFRKRHGIYFTDRDLARLALRLVKHHVPDLGERYLVVDPACGSGNLVASWRSPLPLQHKVVSDIDPELLSVVERRMKVDAPQASPVGVVAKDRGRGLNFLDVGAADYLDALSRCLHERGRRADRPIAFLCNPPYRSDDDQSVSGADYPIDPSILELTGADASSERYCCFLAQMKLVCDRARERGLPEGSLLLLFTKSAWMSDRSVFQPIRRAIAGSFELVDGLLVNGAEFFDLKGRFPVAFTIWRHAPGAGLAAGRPLVLRDLTWARRSELRSIAWAEPEGDRACDALFSDPRSRRVALGVPRPMMRQWSGATSTDFKRSRRKTEPVGASGASGLPRGDRRVANKKAYGEAAGRYVGFMDDLTPCRTARAPHPGRPWFRLDAPFMDCRKGRCLSGPPDQKGFCATDGLRAERLFQWFALQRTFAAHGYPMWVDNLQLWPMSVPERLRAMVRQIAFAIGFGENECVDTTFPAGNPTRGAPASRATNPMSPLDSASFWSTTMASDFERQGRAAHAGARSVVDAVHELYARWQSELGREQTLRVPYSRRYFVGRGVLTRDSGIVQIKDYADELDRARLRAAYDDVQAALKALRAELYAMLLDEGALQYFAEPAR